MFENLGCTLSGNVATCDVEALVGGTYGDGEYWWHFFAPNNATPTIEVFWYKMTRTGGVWDTDGEPPLTVTRIIDLEPATTTATSTSFQIDVTGYVNVDQFTSGDNFVVVTAGRKSSAQTISMVQAYQNALNPAPNTFSFVFPLSSSGSFSFSTTTDTSLFPEGEYFLTAYLDLEQVYEDSGYLASLWNNLIDLADRFANPTGNYTASGQQYSKSVTFIIGASTWYDQFVSDFQSERELDQFDTNTCNPLSMSFAVLDCLKGLIIPSEYQLSQLWNTMYGNIMTHQPFGWVARFIEIITFGESVMPPALEYTYGDSSPEELQGKTISIQIFEKFDFVNSIESDTTHKTIWDIVMPYFNTIIALGVLGVILADILQIGIPSVGRGSEYGDYQRSGEIPVVGLPDQRTENRVTYSQTQPVKIKDNTRRRII